MGPRRSGPGPGPEPWGLRLESRKCPSDLPLLRMISSRDMSSEPDIFGKLKSVLVFFFFLLAKECF